MYKNSVTMHGPMNVNCSRIVTALRARRRGYSRTYFSNRPATQLLGYTIRDRIN